jgi:hypothetical protein
MRACRARHVVSGGNKVRSELRQLDSLGGECCSRKLAQMALSEYNNESCGILLVAIDLAASHELSCQSSPSRQIQCYDI